jgi:hypothetical protein
MKTVRALFLALVLFAGAGLAWANSVFPDQIISLTEETRCPANCASLPHRQFSFTTPASGTGSLFFTNSSDGPLSA